MVVRLTGIAPWVSNTVEQGISEIQWTASSCKFVSRRHCTIPTFLVLSRLARNRGWFCADLFRVISFATCISVGVRMFQFGGCQFRHRNVRQDNGRALLEMLEHLRQGSRIAVDVTAARQHKLQPWVPLMFEPLDRYPTLLFWMWLTAIWQARKWLVESQGLPYPATPAIDGLQSQYLFVFLRFNLVRPPIVPSGTSLSIPSYELWGVVRAGQCPRPWNSPGQPEHCLFWNRSRHWSTGLAHCKGRVYGRSGWQIVECVGKVAWGPHSSSCRPWRCLLSQDAFQDAIHQRSVWVAVDFLSLDISFSMMCTAQIRWSSWSFQSWEMPTSSTTSRSCKGIRRRPICGNFTW